MERSTFMVDRRDQHSPNAGWLQRPAIESFGAMDDLAQIDSIIATINDAWQKEKPGEIAAKIRRFIADDAVIIGPALTRVVENGDAFAKSYDDFAGSARFVSVELDPPDIDLLGETAVATMEWQVRYVLEEVDQTETGYDVYVFRRDRDEWKLTWRHIASSAHETH